MNKTEIMKLDDAIKHCEDVINSSECEDCRNEHKQLAIWLKELKEFKETTY